MNKKFCKKWIPGVLSESQLEELFNEGLIEGIKNKSQIDASSFDLCITSQAYEMIKGSVKPFGKNYLENILKSKLAKEKYPEENGIFSLNSRHTYLFKVREKIKKLEDESIWGQATARSTIGRVDVLARLIVDGMKCYEYFDPDGLKTGNGDMYVEVTPMTFPVRVKEGIPLSQLRLFVSEPENVRMWGKELYKAVLLLEDSEENNGTLSVDLRKSAGYGKNISAFRTKKLDKYRPIDLWKDKVEEIEKPDPTDYWESIDSDKEKEIVIDEEYFYILRSKERIALPPGVAVYCRAIDETIGEMRIHYAGFVHPHFGFERNDNKVGTPLIFEVRGHDVNVVLRQEERMANLIFYRMSEDSKRSSKSYGEQELELSKLFNLLSAQMKTRFNRFM